MRHTEPDHGLEESMPEQTPRRCDFVAQDLIVKVDMTLAGDVKAIDPAVEKIMSAVREIWTRFGSGIGDPRSGCVSPERSER
jgi:hypothetical protein